LEGGAGRGWEGRREGGLGGGFGAAEAQRVGQDAAAAAAAAAAERGDGRQGLPAGEHGDDGPGEDRGEGAEDAARVARGGEFGQGLEQRQPLPGAALRDRANKVRPKAYPIPLTQPTSINQRPEPANPYPEFPPT